MFSLLLKELIFDSCWRQSSLYEPTATIKDLSLGMDRSMQTVQEQSDQGLHCLTFLHILDLLLYGTTTVVKVKGNYSSYLMRPTF